ncbi:MAG: competence/damage-inducible protein A [Deltaproteobacteria bacterium]|nr:competence/damage-inducible protein A [Deltaproteobacteria bacterium]MBW2413180.1 competence/damage-inducible protein A [Deltaproteobacteria bacterium]
MSQETSTAGILIIGNEILSGKFPDENAPFLLKELRVQGVDVERVHTIPDEIDVIADEVARFARDFTYVITTGGVGPTHDDVTLDGVARAFGESLVRHEQMERMLREAMRDGEPNASLLKMCDLPESAELLTSPDLWFPLVRVRNAYVFPGVPRLLKLKFESSRELFVGRPISIRRIFLSCNEHDVAQHLHDLLEIFPEVMIGSYPRFEETEFRTLLTLESRDSDYLGRAVDSLVGKIPADDLVRVE